MSEEYRDIYDEAVNELCARGIDFDLLAGAAEKLDKTEFRKGSKASCIEPAYACGAMLAKARRKIAGEFRRRGIDTNPPKFVIPENVRTLGVECPRCGAVVRQTELAGFTRCRACRRKDWEELQRLSEK